jgi:hypothetical protein
MSDKVYPTMSRARAILRLSAALTLTLFLGWVGVGVAHQHAENPGCQVCKLLHSGAAELGSPLAAPTPKFTYERFALPVTDTPTERFLPHPCGRGPPVV